MKKGFKYYVSFWAVLLILFNAIAFVSVGWIGQEKYTASFWIGYVFITLTFIGQLACANVAFKADTLQRMFYNLSLITTSYTGLLLSFIVGGLCMLISPLPYWVGAVLCALILAFNAITVVKASAAIDIVSAVGDKVKANTLFVKSLTLDAENLMAKAKSEAVKAECKKIYEAVRYSDPMSSDALASIESEISMKFAKLAEAVSANNMEQIIEVSKEVMILLEERNKKCEILK